MHALNHFTNNISEKRKETFKQNVSVISTRFISFDSLPGAVQEKTCRKNSE